MKREFDDNNNTVVAFQTSKSGFQNTIKLVILDVLNFMKFIMWNEKFIGLFEFDQCQKHKLAYANNYRDRFSLTFHLDFPFEPLPLGG